MSCSEEGGEETRAAQISDQKALATAALPRSSEEGGSDGERRREPIRVLVLGSLDLRREKGLRRGEGAEEEEERTSSPMGRGRSQSKRR